MIVPVDISVPSRQVCKSFSSSNRFFFLAGGIVLKIIVSLYTESCVVIKALYFMKKK